MTKTLDNEFLKIIMGAGKEEAEFIPIVTEFNEEEDDTNHPETLPILPLRNTVLFPGVVIPLTIGRSKSFKLIKDIHKTTKFFGAVAQKELEIEDPKPDDIYKVGTLAEILKVIEMPDDTISVIIQGKKRFNINQYLTDEPYHMATVSYIAEDKTIESKRSFQAIVSSLKDMSLKIIKLSASIPQEASFAIKNIDNPSFLINFICSNSDIETAEKQKLLTENSLYKRAEKLLGILVNQVQMLELKNDIQIKVKKEIDKQQKEYLLHQQIKTIQQELGGGPAEQEIKE
ncbi:MAG: LON peptidase substrate-binding domain-containing protein, partial [Bacteroidota bacterium]|nr:LON peptidase substrate-binding domain-containing protein [Bacteroidota bacterium]